MGNSTEIEQLQKNDEGNYGVSIEALGTRLELATNTIILYERLKELVRELAPDASQDEIVSHRVALTFLGACRYHFVGSALAVFRGHVNDGIVFLRRAVELCAFAAVVKRHPHKAAIWVKAGNGDAAYREYQKKFDNRSLFPANDASMQALYRRYDLCSKAMHSTVHSLFRHVGVIGDEAHFSYGDLDTPHDGGLHHSFDYIVDTHHHIQMVFTSAFEKQLRANKQQWVEFFDAMEGKMNTYRKNWNQTVEDDFRQWFLR